MNFKITIATCLIITLTSQCSAIGFFGNMMQKSTAFFKKHFGFNKPLSLVNATDLHKITLNIIGFDLPNNCKKCQSPRPLRRDEPVMYPEDYCQQYKGNEEEFDYVVVGSGPSGAPIARRMAENPDMKVLVLEAGGDPLPESDIPTARPFKTEHVWKIRTKPDANYCKGFHNGTCDYLYAKFLGGTSCVNLMMYARGNPRDYDEWSENGGGEVWNWNVMKKYFLKLENFRDPRNEQRFVNPMYHSKKGPFTTAPTQFDPRTYPFKVQFMKAMGELGIARNYDFSGKSQIGYGHVTGLLDETGFRNNVAKAYLLNIPDNLKICKKATVHRVLFENKVAVGIEFAYNNSGKIEKKIARARQEHILAAGPISTPQILERSGVGQKKVLDRAGVKLVHELKGVGENLQEQFTNLGCGFSGHFKTKTPRNPMSIALTGLTVFLNMTDFKNEVPDLQWLFLTYAPTYMHFKPEIAQQYQALANKSDILFAGSTILVQASPGSVHIRGTDPNMEPMFDPNVFSAEKENRLTVDGCRLMRKALLNSTYTAQYNFKPIILNECKQHPYNSEEEILCASRLVAFPTHHMAGTTQMGPTSDPYNVVNKNLRVHGLKKLRISDLGVMPVVPRANTEVPGMAVSERAADLLKAVEKKKMSKNRK